MECKRAAPPPVAAGRFHWATRQRLGGKQRVSALGFVVPGRARRVTTVWLHRHTRVTADARKRRAPCVHQPCGPPWWQGGGGGRRAAAPSVGTGGHGVRGRGGGEGGSDAVAQWPPIPAERAAAAASKRDVGAFGAPPTPLTPLRHPPPPRDGPDPPHTGTLRLRRERAQSPRGAPRRKHRPPAGPSTAFR